MCALEISIGLNKYNNILRYTLLYIYVIICEYNK